RTDLAPYIGQELDPDGLRRYVATHNLYGVDLLPSAIRLCELRLWLALSWGLEVDDVHEVPPLPNLDMALRQGNTLLERDDVDSVLSASEGAIAPDVVAHLATAKVVYLDAAGAAKAALRRSIEALESRVFEALLDD